MRRVFVGMSADCTCVCVQTMPGPKATSGCGSKQICSYVPVVSADLKLVEFAKRLRFAYLSVMSAQLDSATHSTTGIRLQLQNVDSCSAPTAF